jgi:ribosomal protein S18 acetylase RimI-like enzyme
MIRLRKPARDDQKIYKMIRKELLPLTQQSFPNLRFNRQDMRNRLKRGKTFVVKMYRKAPLGFIHLMDKNETLWVDMLAMDRNERGKGWGKKLLLKAEKLARLQEFKFVSLHVDELNIKAQMFYEHLGYRMLHHDPRTKCYLYTKDL